MFWKLYDLFFFYVVLISKIVALPIIILIIFATLERE